MSSFSNILIPLSIALIIFIAVFLAISIFSSHIEKAVDNVFAKQLDHLEKELSLLKIPMTPRGFLLFQTGVSIIFFTFGFLIGSDLITKIIIGIVLALVGLVSTKKYIDFMKNKRKQEFEEQFVDALALISNAVKSGLSLMQALELTVKEMDDPVSYEFNIVIQATRVGVPLESALTDFSSRIGSDDLDIFVTAVIIQSQSGGNLTEILESLGKTIRDRFKLQRQIKALTAQGILSAYLLTGLPVFLGVGLYFVQPKIMSLLFTHYYGWILLGISALMISIGSYLVRKVVKINI